jgi:hypothetical protein
MIKREKRDLANNGLKEFNEFIRGYGINLELKRVETNPVLVDNSRKEQLAHYRCKLWRGGKQLKVHVSVSTEDAEPTLFDVLFMLALDASGCDMMAGFQKYREKWHGIFGESGRRLGDIELFWEELESRCRQTQKVSDFFGDAAFEELLGLFGLADNQDSKAETKGLSPASEDVEKH